MMNTLKGYNGRLRKANRIFKRAQYLWDIDGIRFGQAWRMYDRISELAWDVPHNHPIWDIRSDMLILIRTIAKYEQTEAQYTSW